MNPATISRAIPRLLLAALLASAGCRSADPGLPESIDAGAAPRDGTPRQTPPPAPRETLPVDLATALRIAAGSHLDILEARARVREAEGNARSADGYLLP